MARRGPPFDVPQGRSARDRKHHAGNGGTMLAEDLDFREIFKITQTAMALLDADLIFIDVNDQFMKGSGRDLEDLVGRRFREVFPRTPEDRGSDPNWGAIEKAAT